MVLRLMVFGVAVSLLALTTARADEPPAQEEIMVEEVVVEPVEVEVVTAPPPPRVEMSSASLAAGVGLRWGDGTLLFEGERYEFSIKGFSLVDVGASKVSATGDVSNLENVSDFAGRYVAVEGGVAAGVGASSLKMRNDKGVVISLQSRLRGVQLTAATEGLTISIK